MVKKDTPKILSERSEASKRVKNAYMPTANKLFDSQREPTSSRSSSTMNKKFVYPMSQSTGPYFKEGKKSHDSEMNGVAGHSRTSTSSSKVTPFNYSHSRVNSSAKDQKSYSKLSSANSSVYDEKQAAKTDSKINTSRGVKMEKGAEPSFGISKPSF